MRVFRQAWLRGKLELARGMMQKIGRAGATCRSTATRNAASLRAWQVEPSTSPGKPRVARLDAYPTLAFVLHSSSWRVRPPRGRSSVPAQTPGETRRSATATRIQNPFVPDLPTRPYQAHPHRTRQSLDSPPGCLTIPIASAFAAVQLA